jgi:hypothetical protein
MDYSSHRVKDLTETIINDGGGYQHRLDTARIPFGRKQTAAVLWVNIAGHGAFQYEQKFQPEEKFTTEDLLEVALHLSAYYAQHLAEF